ncbi:MAG: ribosome recycling factor [Patescibacteria group bacterium]
MTTDDILREFRPKINETIEHFKMELASIRTGRASAGLVENIRVPYYGAHTPISQMANITIPDAETILIQPWDKGSLTEVERAISNSELNLSPSNDGERIFIKLPPLTEERRTEFVKIVKDKAEEMKISVRNHRQEMMTKWDDVKDKISEDEFERGKKILQEFVDETNTEIESLTESKETELMKI